MSAFITDNIHRMVENVTDNVLPDITTEMTTDVSTRMLPEVTTGIVANVTSSIMSNATFMPGLTLQQQNDEEFYRRLAPVIYLSILMVIGIPGNLLVLVVYFRDFTRSTHRTFILSLAAVDLGVCLVSLPFEIFEMRFQYTFYNVIACKLFRANNNFLSLGSIFTIFCMSIDRYRRVCRPLRIQMTPRVSLFYCLGALVVSLIFAWPNFLISGIRKVALKQNITGSDCSLSDQFAKTIYPIVYGGVLFIIFLIVIVFLIVVYSLIARKIHKHSKFRNNFQSSSSCSSTPTQASTISNPNSNESNERGGNEAGLEQVKLEMTSPAVNQTDIKPPANGDSSSNEITKPDQIESVQMPATNKPEVRTSTTQTISTRGISQRSTNMSTKLRATQPNADKKRTAKITRITFTISLVFILSYLPHLVLSLMTAVKGGFVAKPGPIVSAVLPIVTRSIFINNVANPLIYGFLDPKFRKSCKNAIKTLLR